MSSTTSGSLVEEIQRTLVEEGLVPRDVKLSEEVEAHFWLKQQELRIVGPGSETALPYFEPEGYTDDQLREKLRKYLLFS